MALRAELIGPYCLILVTVLFVLIEFIEPLGVPMGPNGTNDSAKIDCGCPQML